MNSVRSGSISMFIAASVCDAVAQADHVGHVPQVVRDSRRTCRTACASASPRRTSIAASSVACGACRTRPPRRDALAPRELVIGLAACVHARRRCRGRRARSRGRASGAGRSPGCAAPIDGRRGRPGSAGPDPRRRRSARRAARARLRLRHRPRAWAALLRRVEHRLHHRAGVVDEAARRLAAVGRRMSAIGRVATPRSMAACATAGATTSIRRGSNGLGIRYSGPKRRPAVAVGLGHDVGNLGMRQRRRWHAPRPASSPR